MTRRTSASSGTGAGPGGRLPRLAGLAGLAVMALAVIAASCGIPVSSEVDVLAQDEHIELLEGTTSTTAAVPDPDDPSSTPVVLFFAQDNKLESVTREFQVDAERNDVLIALENGPTQAELEQFEGQGVLQTFVPAGLNARFGAFDEALGTQQILVDPAAELRQRVEEQADPGRLIVSQIVCTVLQLNLTGVEGVEIYDGEERIPLTDSAAQPIVGPAMLSDFNDCITGSEERQEQLEAESEPAPQPTTTTFGD